MNAEQVIENAAGQFDTQAKAILTLCEKSGVHLRAEGGNLKAKGNRELIAAWQAMILRHKPEVIAHLTGKPTEAAANDSETLAADYAELTACIIELCQLAGYPGETRERWLAARRNLYPFQYAIECAYFRWQVIRAKAGVYWESASREHNDEN